MRKPEPTKPIDATVQVRLNALERLIDSEYQGSSKMFEDKTGIRMAQVNQWFSGYRALRDKALKRLEEKTRKPTGWFDSASGTMAPKEPTDVTGTFTLNPPPALVHQATVAINGIALSPDALRLAQWLDDVPDEALKKRIYAACMGLIEKRRHEAEQIAERGPAHADGTPSAESPDLPDGLQTERRSGIDRRVQRRR